MFKRLFSSFFALAAVTAVAALLTCGLVFWYIHKNLPEIITLKDYRPSLVTQVFSKPNSKGKPELVGEFYRLKRYVIPYDRIPQLVVRAFISAEDDKFFEHTGVNWVSILRAAFANLKAGQVVQGGSTITQQVTKSLLLTPEKKFIRKLKEVMLSYRLEKNLKKDEILYLYLNEIYLGHGAYGVQAAAKTYFKKDISEVTLAEAALIAGMPQAPGKFSPHLNPKKAKDRQLYVLKRMLENGYITQNQYQTAAEEDLKIYRVEDAILADGAFYLDMVKRQLTAKYGEDAVFDGGLQVTIPTTKQNLIAAHKSLQRGLEDVDKRIGYRGPIRNLGSNEDVQRFLTEGRATFLHEHIGFKVLTKNGALDLNAALEKAGIKNEENLLILGERYEGVVTSLDDAKKVATVIVAGIPGTVSFERMKWAKRARDEKNPKAWYPEPKKVSEIVKKGDVIRVRVEERSPARGIQFSLDQTPEVQGALFSLESRTGNVLAIEGGYDFETSKFNRATQAERQPGSSFKPIIYAAALEKGFTPASIIADSPIVFNEGEDVKWKPTNFEEKFYGDTTFRQALIKSRNIPTIKLLQEVGVGPLIEYAKRIGFTETKFNPDLSISLGSMGVSLFDLTKVYALFPRLGRKVEPVFITRVVDRDGKILEAIENQGLRAPFSPGPLEKVAMEDGTKKLSFPTYPLEGDPNQVLDPRVAYVMTHLMSEVVSYGTGYEAKQIGRPAAGKTGTTNDYLDAWFMGFTPNIVTGSWVGFDTQRPIGPQETGARAALPIWVGFMKEAVENYPNEEFSPPDQIVFTYIDGKTGKPTRANAPGAIREAFIEGTEPSAGGVGGAQSSGTKGPSEDTTGQQEGLGDLFKEDSE